jgi:hypothetical protein
LREINDAEAAFSQDFIDQIVADPFWRAVSWEFVYRSRRKRFWGGSIGIVHGQPSSMRRHLLYQSKRRWQSMAARLGRNMASGNP